MSDTAIRISRRAFMATSVTLAGGAALGVMPIFSGNKLFAASAAPAEPVLTFDAYFTGWPVYDRSGTALAYEPPIATQPGSALAAMSDEEFHRHFFHL